MKNMMQPFGGVFHGTPVLVTGHTGFKGAWLTRWLTSLGAKVTGLALPAEQKDGPFVRGRLAADIRHVEGDIRDAALVKRVVKSARPRMVFHLAAQALVRRSYEIPVETAATNILGTVHVLEAIRAAGNPCSVVVVTSDKCYENREWDYSYRENDPMGGHDVYSASKGCAELMATSYRRSFFGEGSKVALATARAGNVIGPGDWSQDRIIAVHGQKGRVVFIHFAHRQRHGFRDVEEFQIHHHLMAAVPNQVDHREAACQKQLQADLVEMHMIAQTIQPALGFRS